MQGARYTAEFKAEAIKQTTECGYGIVEIAKYLGVSDKGLYTQLNQSREDELLNSKVVAALKQDLQNTK
jgi:transposase